MRPLGTFFSRVKRIAWQNALKQAKSEIGQQLDKPPSVRVENQEIKTKAREVYNREMRERKARKKLLPWKNR